jgi:hypothetical protein
MSRLLELFSGSGTVSRMAQQLGYETETLDINNKFRPSLCIDILSASPSTFVNNLFDIVWASPVCTQYSVARTTGGERNLVSADALVNKALDLIEELAPKVWFIENPRGLLRDRPFFRARMAKLKGLEHETSYCFWNRAYLKPTMIWSNIGLVLPKCRAQSRCKSCLPDGTHPLRLHDVPPSQVAAVPPELARFLIDSATQFIRFSS